MSGPPSATITTAANGVPVEFAAELVGIRKSLSGTTVLDGCTLQLQRGRLHGLVGAGGSGKTLLLKTLATLLRPDTGELRLFGNAVEFDNPAALRAARSRLGVQFQNLALFDFLSVGENVAFPLADAAVPPDEAVLRATRALAEVGLGEASPLAVQELSGGMQRRVAIARAAVSGAELMLFDDPSGGLDPVTTSRIFQLIAELRRRLGNTVVVASHDLDRLEPLCDVFHVMHGGRLVFSGSLADGRRCDDPHVRTFLGLGPRAHAGEADA